jgi:hypothetical protein
MICAVLANIHRDSDEKPEAWKASDFMPGAKTPRDEMEEFAEAVLRGDSFEVDPREMELLKRRIDSTFSNVKP